MGENSDMDLQLEGIFQKNKSFDYDDYTYLEVGCPVSAVSVLMPTLYSLAFVCGLLGHGLVMAVMWRKKHHLSSMDIFVLHLGIADVLLMLTLPFWAVEAVKGWIFRAGFCKVAGVLFKMNFHSGIFILAFISICRYRCLSSNSQVDYCKDLKLVHSCCLLVWLVSLLLSVPDWMFLTVEGEDPLECFHSYTCSSSRLAARLTQTVLGFILPVLVLLFCSSSVLFRLRHSSESQQDRRTLLTAALVLVFLFCWTPYNITFIVDTVRPQDVSRLSSMDQEECEPRRWTVSQTTAAIGLLHCVINPVIYLSLSKELKRRALSLLKFRCEKDRTVVSLWDSVDNNPATVQGEQDVPLQKINGVKQTSPPEDQA